MECEKGKEELWVASGLKKDCVEDRKPWRKYDVASKIKV